MKKTSAISGKILKKRTNESVNQVRVEAWEKNLLIDGPIASAVTNNQGEFTIEIDGGIAQSFLLEKSLEVFFKIYKGENLISDTRNDLIINPEEQTEVTIKVDITPEITNERTVKHTVSGKVRLYDGLPVGTKVEVFSVNVQGEKLLESGNSNSEGKYTITFEAPPKPDIKVKAYTGDKILAESETHFEVGNEITIDLKGKKEFRGPSEVGRFKKVIDPLITNTDPATLGDIQTDYLSKKTGISQNQVKMLVKARQFGSNDVPSDFYYALFKAGTNMESRDLYRVNANRAIDLYSSMQGETVPQDGIDLQSVKNAFINKSIEHILNSPGPLSISNMNDMLSLNLESNEEKRKFVELYFHGNPKDDINKTWEKIEQQIGAEKVKQLKLTGKLGYLTFNNAPLIGKLREHANLVEDPSELALKGFYSTERLSELLGDSIQVPDSINGKDAEEKRSNYIKWISGQLQMSYPNEVLAHQIDTGAVDLEDSEEVKSEVKAALLNKVSNFKIGDYPINKHIQQLEESGVTLSSAAKDKVKALHRTYALAPDFESINFLLKNKLDSATQIIRHSRDQFLSMYSENSENGKQQALQMYEVAENVSALTTNLALGYGTYKFNPKPWIIGQDGKTDETAETVKEYPSMEELFGSLDYASCDHCHSLLSPAAYLVDLLQFIDKDKGIEGANPIKKLFEKRPDIEHCDLNCKNTHTAMPYIDLVNEILEYYFVDKDITGFKGYNTVENITTEELLASPQFIKEEAYLKLNGEKPGFTAAYPFNLPYNRDLSLLRKFYDHFQSPLWQAMEKLRETDALERDSYTYAWTDILIEQLGISRKEFQLYTDHTAFNIQDRYGLESGENLKDNLSTAFDFCKKTNIEYTQLIRLLKTQFINPGARHLPKLEMLQEAFNRAKKDNTSVSSSYGNTSLYQILRQIAQGNGGVINDINSIFPEIEEQEFGGDLKKWVEDTHNEAMSLIFLTPTEAGVYTDFSKIKLAYANPDQTELKEVEYWKFLHFIRLWKKMGWSIEQTDTILNALYDLSSHDFRNGDIAQADQGFKDFFIKLALWTRIRNSLNISSGKEYEESLTLWNDMSSYGENALYKRLFLTPTVLKINDVYKENAYGNYLTDSSKKLSEYGPSLQAALNLKAEELDQLTSHLGFDDTTILSLSNISNLFRYRYLSEKLKISIEELLALKDLSGIAPFAAVDYKDNGNYRKVELIKFIDLANAIKRSGFSIQELKYLFKHEDISANDSPDTSARLSFARKLHQGQKEIQDKYPKREDLSKEQAQNLVTAVYGDKYGAVIYSILTGTATFKTSYSQGDAELSDNITDITKNIHYNDLKKQLVFDGVMTTKIKNDLQGISSVSGDFVSAVQELYNQSQEEYKDFFNDHPEFKSLYEDGKRFKEIIEERLNALVRELQEVYIEQVFSENLKTELPQVKSLLRGKISGDNKFVLHAHSQKEQPVLNDFIQLAFNGVTASYYNGDSISGSPDSDKPSFASSIAFDGKENTLPKNTSDPNGKISVEWRFYLAIKNNGNYNLYLNTDAARVSLWVNGEEITMNQSDSQWENAVQLNFEAGRWYNIRLQAFELKDKAVLKWKSKDKLTETISSSHLFPENSISDFQYSYIKLLKAARLATGFSLSRPELEYFADTNDFRINNESAFEALPAKGGVSASVYQTLIQRFEELVSYKQLKEKVSVQDATLADIFKDPQVKNEDGKLKLLQVKDWQENQLIKLIQRFTGESSSDTSVLYPYLKDRKLFSKIVEAHEIVQKFGVSAEDILAWTTIAPAFEDSSNMQKALRARYNTDKWTEIVQPINDKIREEQRDNLVSAILFQLSKNDSTRHIDSPNKLFEFFLIDVEMSPCMKTSRIKQAISSTQLFIQRCLLNLENNVKPSSINAEQWSWMKNYRVWEANRKVFLYPENWLEPSLRTDKSPFFKEFEGELLQSDINDGAAATALLNYLEKLDKVTQLSICGMCREDEETIHVVGKVSGKSGDYYHRVYNGTWSPWEKISVDIEEGPVIPVFWQNRLFLFWTSVMQKGQDNNQVKDNVADKPSNLNGPPEYRYEINLCWSEYYNGKWQTKRTSDFDNPAIHITKNGSLRASLNLVYSTNTDNSLTLIITAGPPEIPETISENWNVTMWQIRAFKFFNKYGEPEKIIEEGYYGDTYMGKVNSGDYFRFIHGERDLTAFYREQWPGASPKYTHPLLNNQFYRVTDFANLPGAAFSDPFFAQDYKHLFFIEVNKEQKIVSEYDRFGTESPYKESLYGENRRERTEIDESELEFEAENVVSEELRNS